MPGPIVYIKTKTVPAAETTANALKVTKVKNAINMIDGANGIAIEKGIFTIDSDAIGMLENGYDQLIAASIARANNSKYLFDMHEQEKNKIVPAGVQNQNENIDKLADNLGLIVDIRENLKALLAGATIKDLKWWGISIDLNQSAATALASLVGTNLTEVAALLALLETSTAVAVSVILTTAGKLLGDWINDINGPGGVTIYLYMWIVPWVEKN